jgi:hypothetical protein
VAVAAQNLHPPKDEVVGEEEDLSWEYRSDSEISILLREETPSHF